MSDQFTLSIVSIVDTWGSIKGAGFLVSEKRVLTCAHVIAQSLDLPEDNPKIPNQEVQVCFPFASKGKETVPQISGQVIFWRPWERLTVDDEDSDILTYGSDIAVVRLHQDPPIGIEPGRIINEGNLWKHRFRAFGFPAGLDIGEFAWGIILGKLTNGWIQLEGITKTSPFISPGFSGSPVWDDEVGGIVGMIVSGYDQCQKKTAYFIPTQILIEFYPDLSTQIIPSCPYRGLSSFREKDAKNFFGREDFTQKVVESVQRMPFLVITGPSGSGKSSLVHAGLVPRLGLDKTWLSAFFYPERDPFSELADALFPILEDQGQMSEADKFKEIEKLAWLIRQGPDHVRKVVKRILEKHPGTTHLLLIADQFEGLFTLCDLKERAAFLDLLVSLATPQACGDQNGLRLVLTLRIDFLGQVLSYPSLAEIIHQATLLLPAMGPNELRSAIEKPALRLKVGIEPGLIERILNDISYDELSHSSGSLPLLQFTMTQLWKAQKKGLLTHTAYDEIGGVQSSIARYAEEKYEKFPEKEKERVHGLFIKLVHPGEGTQDTGCIATRQEVGEGNWDIVTRLASDRLVVTDTDKKTGQDTVRIIHEALISVWGRLKGWMETDRLFRIWQDRLKVTIRQWKESGEDKSILLRGFLLDQAEDWLNKRLRDLSQEEDRFIHLSLALRESEEVARRAAREAEEAAQKVAIEEKERRRRQKIVWSSVITIVALILALIAVAGWWLSIKQKRNALARQLLAQAELVKREGPGLLPLGLLIAAEAAHRSPAYTNEFDHGLRDGMDLLPRPVRSIAHDSMIGLMALSPDGKLLVTGGSDRMAILWDLHTGKRIRELPHGDKVNGVIFSPDGRYIATASWDSLARVWDLGLKKMVPLVGHQDSVNAIAFNPEAEYVATASADHTARVWERISGLELGRLPHQDNVSDVAFSPDGRYLATASWDNKARIWEGLREKGYRLRHEMSHEGKVSDLDFSPDGMFLATAGFDNTAKVWNIISGQEVYALPHNDKVCAVTFNPDGTYLATACLDNMARIWEVSTGRRLAVMSHGQQVNLVFFSPSPCGDYLATISTDHTARIWAIRPESELLRMVHGDTVTGLGFSPDCRYIITTSLDHTAQVWEFSSLGKDTCIHHDHEVAWVAFSPDGRYLATKEKDQTVAFWVVPGCTKIKYLAMEQENLRGLVTLSQDLRFLAQVSRLDRLDNKGDSQKRELIHLWEITAPNQEITKFTTGTRVNKITLSPQGRYLAWAGADYVVWVWGRGSREKRPSIEHKGSVTKIIFNQDERYMATASTDHQVKILDLPSHQEIACLLHEKGVNDASFSPDGRYLATACIDRTARIWEVSRGIEKSCLVLDSPVKMVIFSPGGKYLLTLSWDNSIGIWKVPGGSPVGSLNYEQEITALCFSPEGRFIGIGDTKGSAMIWNISTGQKWASLTHQKGINDLAFSPDSKYLATASSDKTTLLSIWRPEDMIAEVCARLPRDLIKQEWPQQFENGPRCTVCPDLRL